MIDIDCIGLADCFTPEELVNKIYSQCPDLSPPIPVREIAQAVGIIAIVGMKTEDIGGMLVANEEKSSGVIFYKDGTPIGRQRFTIGHELGHFLLLHHGAKQSCTSKDIKFSSSSGEIKKIESEANQFSQLLLMPDRLISQKLHGSVVNLELLKDISESFEMSFEAIANKCSGLSETPYALIYSKDNVVRYCWRDPKKFQFWVPFKAGDPMPSSSQAVKLSQPSETISESIVSDPDNWINLGWKQRFPKILLEQTYTQLDGYQVTMITVGEN